MKTLLTLAFLCLCSASSFAADVTKFSFSSDKQLQSVTAGGTTYEYFQGARIIANGQLLTGPELFKWIPSETGSIDFKLIGGGSVILTRKSSTAVPRVMPPGCPCGPNCPCPPNACPNCPAPLFIPSCPNGRCPNR